MASSSQPKKTSSLIRQTRKKRKGPAADSEKAKPSPNSAEPTLFDGDGSLFSDGSLTATGEADHPGTLPANAEVGEITGTEDRLGVVDTQNPIIAKEEQLPPPIIAVPTVVTNIPLQLLLGEGEEWTPVKGLNLVSQYPLFTVDSQVRARRQYVITQTVNQTFKQDVTVTLEPGLTDDGLASIGDADILKYAVSIARKRMLEKYGENDPDWMSHWMENRRVEFLLTDFLAYTKRQKTGSAYEDIASALRRLTGMQIKIQASSFGTTADLKQREKLESQFSIVDSFSIVMREGVTRTGARRNKMQYAQVTFNDWIWAYAGDPQQLLTFSNDFFYLSTFKKGVYEKVRKSLGKQPFFMIRMKNLAARMGYLITNDEDEALGKIDKDALVTFKRNLREMIADDDLLDIKCSLEARVKRFGEEMLVFYPRNWKKRLISMPDGSCRTELEAALEEFGGKERVDWFLNKLVHPEEMRTKYKPTSRWYKRAEKLRILFEKRAHGEKLSPSESARLAFLDRLKAIEERAPVQSAQLGMTREEEKADDAVLLSNESVNHVIPENGKGIQKKAEEAVVEDAVPGGTVDDDEEEGLFVAEPFDLTEPEASAEPVDAKQSQPDIETIAPKSAARAKEVPSSLKAALFELRQSVKGRREGKNKQKN